MSSHQVLIGDEPDGGLVLRCRCGWTAATGTVTDAHRLSRMHEATGTPGRWQTIPGLALLAAVVGSIVVAGVLVFFFGPM